jgi:hypothetical protein
MLRKLGIIAVLSLIVVALAVPAWAAKPTAPTSGVHFTKGGEPVCTVTGTTVNCDAELAGLGQGDIDVVTTVSGFAVYTCQNKGGNQAPGQNRVLTGPVVAPTTIPEEEIKNGRALVFSGPVTLTARETVSGAEAGCPNPNWTGVNPQITITSVTFEASQGGVLLFRSEASNPSGLTGTFPLTVTGGAAA